MEPTKFMKPGLCSRKLHMDAQHYASSKGCVRCAKDDSDARRKRKAETGPEIEPEQPPKQAAPIMRVYPRPTTKADEETIKRLLELRRTRGFTRNIGPEWQPIERVDGCDCMHVVSLCRITSYSVEALFKKIEDWLAASPESAGHILKLRDRRDDGWLPYSEVWFDHDACLALCHQNGVNKDQILGYFAAAASEQPADEPEQETSRPDEPGKDLVKTFSFEGKDIRTVMIDGVMHWAGRDVCDRLGYVSPKQAMRTHCKGELIQFPLQTPGGVQEHRMITESDVFRLVVGSELPDAERFRVWLFEEVLPTIRRTGSYGPQTQHFDPIVVLKLGVIEQQNVTLLSRFDMMLGMFKELMEHKTHRRMTTAEADAWLQRNVATYHQSAKAMQLDQRNAELGAAIAIMNSLPPEKWKAALGAINGNQVWAAAQAIEDHNVHQKIEERKAKRRQSRRGDERPSQSQGDDDLGFDFGFDG